MGRRGRPRSAGRAAARRPRKEDHRHPVDPQRDLHRRANRSGRDVACDRGSPRLRRRRLGERVGRERIQDGRVEARYRLRRIAKGARVSARPRDGCGEFARMAEDKGEQGAALLLRSTEAQGIFRQGRAALDAAGFGRFCARRCYRPLRKGRGPERLGAHARYTDPLHQAIKALGMQIFSRDGVHSVTVTGILTPPALDNKTVLTKLLDEHGVVISGGQGKMAGKMWRWGTMGAFSEADMVAALGAFETVIRQMGYRFEEGAAVNAALGVFARTGKKQRPSQAASLRA